MIPAGFPQEHSLGFKVNLTLISNISIMIVVVSLIYNLKHKQKISSEEQSTTILKCQNSEHSSQIGVTTAPAGGKKLESEWDQSGSLEMLLGEKSDK